MKQPKAETQHRVAVFLDPSLYDKVKASADTLGTSITKLLAHFAATEFKYKPQQRQFSKVA